MRLKKPSRIFAVSAGDLFGDWASEEWIKAVLGVVRQCPWHEFIFLTKNLRHMVETYFPSNVWAGVTIDDTENVNERLTKTAYIQSVSVSVKPIVRRRLDTSVRVLWEARPPADYLRGTYRTGT